MSDTPTTRVGAGRQAALYARAPQPSERDRTTAAAQLAACRALAAELGYAVADEATLADDAPHPPASPGQSRPTVRGPARGGLLPPWGRPATVPDGTKAPSYRPFCLDSAR